MKSIYALKPTPPTIEPILDELIQSVTSANTNNLLVSRHLASLAEEPIMFTTRAKVEAMLRREGKASTTTI